MPHHHLDLEGASVVTTTQMKLAKLAVRTAAQERSLAAVYGPPGCGKTFAVDGACETLPLAVSHFVLPNYPSPKEIAVTLLRRLTGDYYSGPRYRLDEHLIEALTQTSRLLVVDEAQRLSLPSVEYLRFLWDEAVLRRSHGAGEAFGLVLVGGHRCYQTLTRYRALSSRVASWAEITPIPASEVVEVIRGFHPLLAEAEEELLDDVDDLYAHGVLRNWATFVKRAQPLCAKLDLDTVDEHVARNVYAQKPLEQAA
jgi:type II secretory pathway predicted ATPase ExeA